MHSAFFSYCEGIGWALAAGFVGGSLAGAYGPASRRPLAALAAILGGTLFYLALSGSGHAAWPGPPLGVLAAVIAFMLAESVVSGAASRTDDSAAPIAGMGVTAGVVLAGICIVVAPLSLPILVAVLALLAVRRQRQTRKHEGLRILR